MSGIFKKIFIFIALFTPYFFLTSCSSTKDLGGGIYEESFTVSSENAIRNIWISSWRRASNVCSSQGKILDIIQDGYLGQSNTWVMRFKCIDLATKQQRDVAYAKVEEERKKQLEERKKQFKIQEELDLKISIEKEKENQKKIKAEEYRKKQLKLAEDQREQALIENCLKNSPIGICRTYYGGKHLYTGKDEYWDYFTKLYTFHLVRNNVLRPVKDIEIQCDQYGPSRTIIKTYNHTVYDIWNPRESKMVNMEFWPHKQLDSIRCFVKSWKPSN